MPNTMPTWQLPYSAARGLPEAVIATLVMRRTALTLALLPRSHGALAGGGGPRRRFANVAAQYVPLQADPALFDTALINEWLHPEFSSILAALRDADVMEADVRALCRGLVTTEAADLYSFPLLSDSACDRLVAEFDNFHTTGLPARRPNSMNNYGARRAAACTPRRSIVCELTLTRADVRLLCFQGSSSTRLGSSRCSPSCSVRCTRWRPRSSRSKRRRWTTITHLSSRTSPTRTAASTCTPTTRM
jgi:hypothetical protein